MPHSKIIVACSKPAIHTTYCLRVMTRVEITSQNYRIFIIFEMPGNKFYLLRPCFLRVDVQMRRGKTMVSLPISNNPSSMARLSCSLTGWGSIIFWTEIYGLFT